MLFKKKKPEPIVVATPESKYNIGDILVAESQEKDWDSKLWDRWAELRKEGFDFPTTIPHTYIPKVQVKTTGTCISKRFDGIWHYTIAYDNFRTIGVEFAEQFVYLKEQ